MHTVGTPVLLVNPTNICISAETGLGWFVWFSVFFFGVFVVLVFLFGWCCFGFDAGLVWVFLLSYFFSQFLHSLLFPGCLPRHRVLSCGHSWTSFPGSSARPHPTKSQVPSKPSTPAQEKTLFPPAAPLCSPASPLRLLRRHPLMLPHYVLLKIENALIHQFLPSRAGMGKSNNSK